MRLIVYVSILLLFCSCLKNPEEVLVDDPDAKEYVDQICENLSSEECDNFRETFKAVLYRGNRDESGRLLIIEIYSKKYEDLTLGDLLDEIERVRKNSEEE